MDNILNITNGDHAVSIMQAAKLPGNFLPWRDILHEGPVPQGLSLNELSRVRADFISGRGWGAKKDILKSFVERDNQLKSYVKYDKVILWFEHDLYDQLQLLQILDWFSVNGSRSFKLTMICTDQYLGECSNIEMLALRKHEKRVSSDQLKLASTAMQAFCSSTPDKLIALMNSDLSCLPFLQQALLRLAQEYPSQLNGLSRTAHQALSILGKGEMGFARLFAAYQKTESARFMGDTSFKLIIQNFLDCRPALLTQSDQKLSITSEGREVLAGKLSWLELYELDQWIGGVHLTRERHWYRDAEGVVVVH